MFWVDEMEKICCPNDTQESEKSLSDMDISKVAEQIVQRLNTGNEPIPAKDSDNDSDNDLV